MNQYMAIKAVILDFGGTLSDVGRARCMSMISRTVLMAFPP